VTLSSHLYRSGQILFFQRSSFNKTAIFRACYSSRETLFFDPLSQKTLFSEPVFGPDSTVPESPAANHTNARGGLPLCPHRHAGLDPASMNRAVRDLGEQRSWFRLSRE
jgi:hypothetical protein